MQDSVRERERAGVFFQRESTFLERNSQAELISGAVDIGDQS